MPTRKLPKRAKSPRRFLGLELDRKTNVISFVAFVLSIAGLSGQLYFYFQGPRIALQPADQVVFFGDANSQNGKIYLKLTSRMSYVNTGQPGFNDAIRREYATVTIGDRHLHFYWKRFVASDSKGSVFELNPKGDAVPMVVNAGAVETHETFFAPITREWDGGKLGDNFIEFSEFVRLAQDQKSIKVSTTYETFGGSKGGSECVVAVDERFMYYIGNGWLAPACKR